MVRGIFRGPARLPHIVSPTRGIKAWEGRIESKRESSFPGFAYKGRGPLSPLSLRVVEAEDRLGGLDGPRTQAVGHPVYLARAYQVEGALPLPILPGNETSRAERLR